MERKGSGRPDDYKYRKTSKFNERTGGKGNSLYSRVLTGIKYKKQKQKPNIIFTNDCMSEAMQRGVEQYDLKQPEEKM